LWAFTFLCSTNQGIASLNLRARERSSGWTCYQIEEKKNVVQGKKKIIIGLAQFFFSLKTMTATLSP
jgi:hypothetical protein